MEPCSKNNNNYLVIPVLDELENLKWLLPQLLPRWNVLIVDNGSTDGSYEYSKELGVLTIRVAKKGYGIAVKTGIEYLLSHSFLNEDGVVVIFDADASSPISKIEELINHAKENKSCMIIAQRTHKERGAMPAHAKFGNWLQTFLIYMVTGHQYKDMGPMRALSVEAFKLMGLTDASWGWNVEMQIKAANRKIYIHEIDVLYSKRKYGKSKISGSVIGSIRAGFKILYCVFYHGIFEFVKKPRLLVYRFKKIFKANV